MTNNEALSSELTNCFYTGIAVGLSVAPTHGAQVMKISATATMLKCSATALITRLIPDEYTGIKFGFAIASKVGALLFVSKKFDFTPTKVDIASNMINEALYRSFNHVEAHTNKTISLDERIFVAETYTALFEHPAKYMTAGTTMMGAIGSIAKDVFAAVIAPYVIRALDGYVRPHIEYMTDTHIQPIVEYIESLDIMGMGSNHTESTAEAQ